MTPEDYERIGREWAENHGVKLKSDKDIDCDLDEELTWWFSGLPMELDFDVTWIDSQGRQCESSPEDEHDSESDAYIVLGHAIHHLRGLVK